MHHRQFGEATLTAPHAMEWLRDNRPQYSKTPKTFTPRSDRTDVRLISQMPCRHTTSVSTVGNLSKTVASGSLREPGAIPGPGRQPQSAAPSNGRSSSEPDELVNRADPAGVSNLRGPPAKDPAVSKLLETRTSAVASTIQSGPPQPEKARASERFSGALAVFIRGDTTFWSLAIATSTPPRRRHSA
jgi:hypothetical protein